MCASLRPSAIVSWLATSTSENVAICNYQSEVHNSFGHQLPQETELHLDFGDVRWFGGSAKRNCKQPPGAEHVLGGLLASCISSETGRVRDMSQRDGSESETWVRDMGQRQVEGSETWFRVREMVQSQRRGSDTR